MEKRRAVVVFNLGGPDSLDAVQPFLFNLFSDKAIIGVPQPLRWLIARLISWRRVGEARKIYEYLGGSSPLVPETEDQADALEELLNDRDPENEYRVFVAMRYWHPFFEEAAQAVKDFDPQDVMLMPLFPQFSTTTTGTAFDEWERVSRYIGLAAPVRRVCCYPHQPGWVAAQADLLKLALEKAGESPVRILFSAHGLPKRIIAKGDPYAWQVEQGAQAIVDAIDGAGLDWRVSYQSRVGPVEWIGPQTDAEIAAAGREGKGVIVLPIAFVSEHSETLVELDIDYAKLAVEAGAQPYIRVPALGAHPLYIEAMGDMAASAHRPLCSAQGGRICPAEHGACPLEEAGAGNKGTQA